MGVELGLTLREEQMQDIWDQGAAENIWALERICNKRLEKTA
jgi:hypothetical protein